MEKKTPPRTIQSPRRRGAAGRIRTADLILTKDALYRLSYSSICAAFAALYTKRLSPHCYLATQNGLEPSTSSVTG